MVTTNEIAWLAGFIDADGCIRLSKGWKNKKGINSLVPQVSIHNTCVVTLNRCINILEQIIPGYQTQKRKRESINHANMFSIVVMGIKRVRPLLETLRPYLITKQLEADVVLEFMQRRLYASSHNAHYEPRDFQAFFVLKGLKKSRHLRDFVPTIEEIFNQDKVRTDAKALEEAEMSSRLSPEEIKKFASTLVWYRKDRSRK